jgi:hypothetical protein
MPLDRGRPSSASISLRLIEPFIAFRSLRAAPAIACGDGASGIALCQWARRDSRTARASGQ